MLLCFMQFHNFSPGPEKNLKNFATFSIPSLRKNLLNTLCESAGEMEVTTDLFLLSVKCLGDKICH